ncbi:L-fucose kinase isoform X1 [Oncorhynchus nerka]|uniref:L-fucose kinase isoform X1 n=1 Tax=Oncorhynchus nerka TaxID=8023 RepID=UPI00113289B7|nr:L-fucose kinase isoform X1 [Oncorhynchus nerka]
MSSEQVFSWTVVVLTCQHKDSVYAFQRELEVRQQRGGLLQGTLLLTVSDPQEPGLGSGGATLNALLVAAEHLSARAGYTVVTADVLDDARILILHTGRDFPWDSCGRAFCWLPVEKPAQTVQGPVCCLDMLLDCLSNQVCPGSPPGVWVCSTDMILTMPTTFKISWEGFSGVRVLALPGDVSYAANHGVYFADEQGRVRDIIYKGSEERIRRAAQPDGMVPLVSGPVFFCRRVLERLLKAHVTPPLDGCTYMGMDSGAPPIQISLFLDLLMCLCSDLSESEFVNGERTGCSSPISQQGAVVRSARALLWRILRGTTLHMVYVPGGCYDYLTLSGREHIARLTKKGTERDTLSHIQNTQCVSDGGRVINSVLEGDVSVASGAVIQHCHLQGPVDVHSGCLLSGLEVTSSSHIQQLALTNDHIIQGHHIQLGEMKITVYTVLGAYDDLKVSCDDDGATFLNHRWSDLYSRTGIQPEDLWGSGRSQSLMEARLFPVFQPRGGAVGLEVGVCWLLGGPGALEQWRAVWRLSLREVLSLTDQEGELRWREALFFQVGRRRVMDNLKSQSDRGLLPSFRAAVLGGQHEELLCTLDSITAGSGENLGVAARCLACIADVLACLAGEGRGGLRSGPAANPAWSHAFSILEQGDLLGGVQALATERAKWLSRPDLLVRAARHYEAAGQVLLRQAVMLSQRFIYIGQGEVPPLGEWQDVECPARLDLSGGWSDTPPIAFEHGGAVVNVAVKVDGRRPIGARARRIKEPRLLLVSSSGVQDDAIAMETVCERLEDLKDHCVPYAPAALLKAVCVCSGLVTYPSRQSLDEQLLQRWGGGVEIHTWSLLPHGSGLGTSSILAGAVLAAVYRCTGRTYDTDSLIHAVLHLEQMLTTGGGWQDQVGGLVGGVKVARSKACLPLRVEVERLPLSDDFLLSLQQHLLLVYTGKTRLARNLLQDTVRRWYSRIPSIVENAGQLVDNAEECARACTEGSLPRLGACLERYWGQKKVMAPGCEPAAVRTMMDALRPLALGQTLAGAGGGGFLYLLTRQPQQGEAVRQVLNNTQGLRDFSVHPVELDMDGISLLKSS